MINNLEPYLTYENIYLVANWGVIPFWLKLIFIPNNGVTKFFVHSVVTPLLLGVAYVYIGYKIYLEGNIFEVFQCNVNIFYGFRYAGVFNKIIRSINGFVSTMYCLIGSFNGIY